jgi:hypothetical protein
MRNYNSKSFIISRNKDLKREIRLLLIESRIPRIYSYNRRSKNRFKENRRNKVITEIRKRYGNLKVPRIR